jgi:hypothetical protein
MMPVSNTWESIWYSSHLVQEFTGCRYFEQQGTGNGLVGREVDDKEQDGAGRTALFSTFDEPFGEESLR